jgi:hypothetical protein
MSAPFEAKAKHGGATAPVFTVSTAASAEARTWRIEDRRTLTWEEVCGELLDPRTAPVGGAKDGLCFSPAVFTGTRRVAAEVAGISLLVADIDCGLDIGEIVPLLRASGYAWAIGSTHGHMKREFTKRFAPDVWARLMARFGSVDGVALAWARMGFVPSALAGGIERAVVSEAAGGKAMALEIVLAHPVPRWRVCIPLEAPWLPPGGPGRAAGQAWSRAYLLAWAGLGLGGLFDPSCADPPRLYFTGRQPALVGVELAGGLVVKAEFYSSAPGLPLAPFAALVGAPSLLPIKGTVEAMAEAREVFAAAMGEAGRTGKRRGLPGGGGKRSYAPWLVSREGVGEIDLELWHHQNGTELMLARLIEEQMPAMLDGSRPDSPTGRVHIECPRGALHSSDGPGATFCWNGSGWMSRGAAGRERGGMFCNHAACSWVTQGRWLGALLECGAVGWDDLDAAAAVVMDKRGRAAMTDLGDGAVPPLGSGANRDGPESNSGTDAAPASADQAAPPESGAEGMPGDRPGVASCPIPPADDAAIVQAIRFGREAAMAAGDENGAALAELQFQATERFVCERIDGRFYDMRATGPEAAQALNKGLMMSILSASYGFPEGAKGLIAWARWDRIRRQAGLAWCIVDGIAYQPRGLVLVSGTVKGWLYNLWRPGPRAWPEPVGDDDPAIVDLMALVTNVTGDERERDGLLWWMADMKVREGGPRVTWGPLNFGPQGCGKSLMLRVMAALVGKHNAALVTFRDFVRSTENVALVKQLTGIEEAGMVARRGFENKVDFYDLFKPYYTADWLRLSQKYVTGQDVQIPTRIAINANDGHALALPPDDRRVWTQRARGGKLDGALAERLDARITDVSEVGKWIRWLCDGYAGWTVKQGFSPFRCPTDDVPSEVKQEVIEETLPAAGRLAADICRERASEGRTVLAFAEIVRAVIARMQLDPGESPAWGQVHDGLIVGGWAFVVRGRVGGRIGKQTRFWVQTEHIERVGLGFFTFGKLAKTYLEETKGAK